MVHHSGSSSPLPAGTHHPREGTSMTTERQIAANRQNAQHSTGPRTQQGKAVASRNNTRHGLRATTPVIPRLESPEDWAQHREATIASLAPDNILEASLAERVALILWRLDRVA